MTKTNMNLAILALTMIGCQLGTDANSANSSSSRVTLSSSSQVQISSAGISSMGISSSSLQSSSSISSAQNSSSSMNSVSSSSSLSSSSSVQADFAIECTAPNAIASAAGKYTQHCMAYNRSNVDLNMIVYRKNLQLPAKWSSSFCFGLQCYADFIDSSEVSILKAKDSLPIPVYTNINGNGTAKQTMVLERVSDHLNVEASIAVTY